MILFIKYILVSILIYISFLSASIYFYFDDFTQNIIKQETKIRDLEFKNFKEWAELNNYTDELTIDRINNDGNYEPGNCEWVTIQENIKRRNLAKKNYTPPKEVKELPKKYQAIVDLLPYASDKFLEDIYKKLKTMKEIQTI